MNETVHYYCGTFELGQTKPLPENCTANDLIEYALTRFGVTLVGGKVVPIGKDAQGRDIFRASLMRICPTCRR